MMFYTFALDKEAQKMCTIVTPFGPFKYIQVPMGLVNSPVFAQARMDHYPPESTAVVIMCMGLFCVMD